MMSIIKSLQDEKNISVVRCVIESSGDIFLSESDNFSLGYDEKVVLLNELYQKYHTRCFWSYRKEHKLSLSDMDWVKQKLLKYGGRTALFDYKKLCR